MIVRYFKALPLFLVFQCFTLSLALALPLDEVDIGEIRKMQLDKTGDTYFMDVELIAHNMGKRDLKLKNMELSLAIASAKYKNIHLGTANKKELLIPRQKGEFSGRTSLSLRVNLGSDIRTLHKELVTSNQTAALLSNPNPKINLHMFGKFDAGIRSQMGWSYKGLSVDWMLNSKVSRDVLICAFRDIKNAADNKKY